MRLRPKPRTLRQRLVRAVVMPAVSVGAFAVGLHVGPMFGVVTMAEPDRDARVEVVDPAIAVLAEHAEDCWRGLDSPKAELPGAAIVRLPNGDVVYTTRHALVDAAFGEALGRPAPGLDTVALCR